MIVIFPWFSRNWLTIITSTINAWNWGVNYQEGLEFYSLESWIFYFKKLPLIFGPINFSIILTTFENCIKWDNFNEIKYNRLDY